jgi:hypothetical protein
VARLFDFGWRASPAVESGVAKNRFLGGGEKQVPHRRFAAVRNDILCLVVYCCCCCWGELFGGLEFPKPPGEELGLFCIPPGELPNVPELNPLLKPELFVPLLPVPAPAGCPFRLG